MFGLQWCHSHLAGPGVAVNQWQGRAWVEPRVDTWLPAVGNSPPGLLMPLSSSLRTPIMVSTENWPWLAPALRSSVPHLHLIGQKLE